MELSDAKLTVIDYGDNGLDWRIGHNILEVMFKDTRICKYNPHELSDHIFGETSETATLAVSYFYILKMNVNKIPLLSYLLSLLLPSLTDI